MKIFSAMLALSVVASTAWAGTSEMVGEGLGSIAGHTTAVGFLVWFAWYTQTKIIPKLVDDFRREMEAARELYREEVASERSAREASDSRLLEVLARIEQRFAE